jgi:hypothetical protein
VRPSDVRIHCKDAPSYAVEAKVVAAEFRGASRVYELSLPSGALVRCEQSYEVDLHLGDSVHVSLTPGQHASVPDAD